LKGKKGEKRLSVLKSRRCVSSRRKEKGKKEG